MDSFETGQAYRSGLTEPLHGLLAPLLANGKEIDRKGVPANYPTTSTSFARKLANRENFENCINFANG